MDIFDRLKAAAPTEWASYVDHSFVRQMGQGSLPETAFRTYLVQDYLFLIQFARAWALAAYKSRRPSDIRAAQAGLAAILDETDLHVRLCARWGLSKADIEAAPEHQATVAYTRFVLDCGAAGDLLDLHVALSPCVIGYAEIGRALSPDGVAALGDHPYREWIGEYAGRVSGRGCCSAPAPGRAGGAQHDRAALHRAGGDLCPGVAAGGGFLADGVGGAVERRGATALPAPSAARAALRRHPIAVTLPLIS